MTVSELESRVDKLERRVTELQEELERTRVAARIRRGLDQVAQGLTVPAREAMEALRQKHGIAAR